MEKYEISTNSWHWKLYLIAVAMWAAFLDDGLHRYERPNLCSYVRTLCIYLPIMFILNVGIYTSPVWLIGFIYAQFDGNILIETLMWFAWLRWALYVFIAIVIAGVIIWATKKTFRKFAQMKKSANDTKNEVSHEVTPTTTTRSFTHLMLQSLSDRHDMICRPISAKECTTTKGRLS